MLRFSISIVFATALLFGMIALNVVTGVGMPLLDAQVALYLHQHASAGLIRWMSLVSWLHSIVAMIIYTCVIAILAVRMRLWRRLSMLALCVVGGMLLNVLMKFAFHRVRPHFVDPVLTLNSYSFPSGHVAAATIFYGLGVMWVFGRTRSIHWRSLAVVVASLAIALVGFSRMLLGVHYLSDIVAAFAESVAWLALCHIALAVFWRNVAIKPGNAEPESDAANIGQLSR